MTIADQSDLRDEFPDGTETQGDGTQSGQNHIEDEPTNTEVNQPDLAKADSAESDQPLEAAEVAPTVNPGDSAQPSESHEVTPSVDPGESLQVCDASEGTPPAEIRDSAQTHEAVELGQSVDPGDSARASEEIDATDSVDPGDPAQVVGVAEGTLPAENRDSAATHESVELAHSVDSGGSSQAGEAVGVTPSIDPGDPAPEAEAAPPQVSGLLVFVAALLAFGALLAVGVVFTLNLTKSAISTEPAPPQETSPAPETRVMGTVDMTGAGVKGQLTTKWDGKLGYNFVIEPDDPMRQAAFALTVSTPPRPASMRIQIKNSNGFVLCFQDVLLKYDPRKAAAISSASVQTAAGKPLSAKAAEEMKTEQEAKLAQEDAAETEREHGRNIFQLNTGPDGKIQSISSQGEIPCPQSLYEGMGYWSFLPDFPSPDEQAAWLNKKTRGPTGATEVPTPQVSGHSRMPYVSVPQPGKFLMAGDDSIVEFDAASGNIQTGTGKVFSIDKAGANARVIAGLELPVRIHYSCDQNAACILTQGDEMILHAHLSK